MPEAFNIPQWQVVATSLLAGLGVGYILGLLLTRRRIFQTNALGGPPSNLPQSSPDPELRTAISELRSEVEQLRSSVERSIMHLEAERGIGLSLSHVHTEGTGEFVSARDEDEDAEDQFWETDEDEGEEREGVESKPVELRQLDLQRLDELGEKTYEDESSCHTLLEELDKLLAVSPVEPELLWRKTRVLLHLSSLNEHDTGKEMEFLDQAVEVGKKSLELDDGLWQSHYWYALAIGSQVKHQSIQKKIVGGYEYKDHLDSAVKLKPDEPLLHHYRGRWFYEVAGVSWLERKTAAALFATPPEATYDEAMEAFMKVENLKPQGFKSNMLMVAKCHLKLSNQSSAMEWLEKAARLAITNREDKSSQKEVEDLLLQLSAV